MTDAGRGAKSPGQVHKVCGASGRITTLAGGSPGTYGDDGIGNRAGLGSPCGVAVDHHSGRLIVTDAKRHSIRSITCSEAFWSNSIHRLFSFKVRTAVRTVLLCSHRLTLGGGGGGGDSGDGGLGDGCDRKVDGK